MREIKFRSWDARGKQMDIPDAIANGIDGEKYQIMQCTGLKDKNGKEIYEGDIIRTPVGEIAKVIWDDMGAYFLAGFFPEFSGGKRCAGFRSYHSWLCEVIGNIWENKELLNGN